MGVYIPNEDMPEDCYTCFCYETEFDMCSLTGKRLDNIRIRQDDCPLIEIDDEIWENEKYKLIRMTQAVRINKAMAERRADEHNTERD